MATAEGERDGGPARFSRLGTRIVLFFVALLVIVQGLSAFLVIEANSQIARQTVDQELEQGGRVFQQLLAQKQARLEQGAGILSADFAFRQAIATNDTGTILSVLRNHGARVGANVMTLASLDNVVRADTLDDAELGHHFAFSELIQMAAAEGKASSIVVRGDKLYQLVVVPVLAPEPIAWVGLAFEVDDAVAKDMHQLTGLEVTFASRMGPTEGWQLHASTLPVEFRPGLASALAGAYGIVAGEREVTLGGEEYETRLTDLETRADKRVVAILQKPLRAGACAVQAHERVVLLAHARGPRGAGGRKPRHRARHHAARAPPRRRGSRACSRATTPGTWTWKTATRSASSR